MVYFAFFYSALTSSYFIFLSENSLEVDRRAADEDREHTTLPLTWVSVQGQLRLMGFSLSLQGGCTRKGGRKKGYRDGVNMNNLIIWGFFFFNVFIKLYAKSLPHHFTPPPSTICWEKGEGTGQGPDVSPHPAAFCGKSGASRNHLMPCGNADWLHCKAQQPCTKNTLPRALAYSLVE